MKKGKDPNRKVLYFIDGIRKLDGRRERIGRIFATETDTQERINTGLQNDNRGYYTKIIASPLSGNFADNYEVLEVQRGK